jgi:hypothetical protein
MGGAGYAVVIKKGEGGEVVAITRTLRYALEVAGIVRNTTRCPVGIIANRGYLTKDYLQSWQADVVAKSTPLAPRVLARFFKGGA